MNDGHILGESLGQIKRLFRLESEIHALGQLFGLKLKLSPASLETHLLTLSEYHRNSMERNLSNLKTSLEICAQKKIDPWDDRKFLRLSMRVLGVSLPSDYLDKTSEDDLIEGYDKDRIQVFRNLRFMQTSAYSLMEIQAYEWPMLFDRSSVITDQIISYTDHVLWENNRSVELDIPEHYIREVRTRHEQTLAVQFRIMAPLFSGPNQPYGFLVSCQARILPKDDGATRLDFI
jgi:hypothetical protein